MQRIVSLENAIALASSHTLFNMNTGFMMRSCVTGSVTSPLTSIGVAPMSQELIFLSAEEMPVKVSFLLTNRAHVITEQRAQQGTIFMYIPDYGDSLRM